MAKNKQNQKKIESVEATLHKVVDRAKRIADGAREYLDLIANEPRIKPEIGKFYKTFDGSVVYIARTRSECGCPACTAKRTGAADGMPGSLAGLFSQFGFTPLQAPEGFDPLGGETPTESPHREKPEGEPTEFVAIIIQGGHGLKQHRGEEPGEAVVVQANGLVSYADLTKDQDETEAVSKAFLSFAGLSLRREMKLKLVED